MSGLNLTSVKARVNGIKKNLFYGDSAPSVKLVNLNEVLLEVTKDCWWMPPDLVSNIATGSEYFDFFIADADDEFNLPSILPITTVVEVNGERYKKVQHFGPRGLTKQWNLRLESTGEKSG